jgi:hypothetical protein
VQDANGAFASSFRSIQNFCLDPVLWSNSSGSRQQTTTAVSSNLPTLSPIPAKDLVTVHFPHNLVNQNLAAVPFSYKIVSTTGSVLQENANLMAGKSGLCTLTLTLTNGISSGQYFMLLYINETRYAIPFTISN